MSDSKVYYPPEGLANDAHIGSMDNYRELYTNSIKHPSLFWSKMASQFHWETKPTEDKALSYNFDLKKGHIFIRWFSDGKTNVCYNCLDRHVKNGLGSKVAFLWEGNDPNDRRSITYEELLAEVISFGASLRRMRVTKGDRVAIYMPMVIEQVVAVLACARIGAIHSVVFGGFSAESLADRICDAGCRVLVTCDGAWRGTKLINLMQVASAAMDICESRGKALEQCIVLRHLAPSTKVEAINGTSLAGECASATGTRPVPNFSVRMRVGRDVWWENTKSSADCPVEWVNAEDGLFILYTSGSTGRPKGMFHTTGGYMVYAATTAKFTFDLHPDDVYWCTADIGWITGHSYLIYGPLLNGVTSVIFEGLPTWPDYGRYWSIVERYQVTKFYTAPTVIRLLIAAGDQHVKKYNLSSLKILGTVGEPINPTAWSWYYEVVGGSRCAIVDTFWQTETGGHMITGLPGATPMKPGSAGRPFFGVAARLLKEEHVSGTPSLPSADSQDDVHWMHEGEASVREGYLVFGAPWPGIARTIYGDHKRFEDIYFGRFPGYFMTGDGALTDKQGDFWITGRIDDMLNMSGHLLSTAEVESALVTHPLVSEAAVVARHHEVKGECLHCFVTLKGQPGTGHGITPELRRELVTIVRTRIAPFATPDFIQAAPILPKTRSGKIIRRILRKIANGERDYGDLSTLADPDCIHALCAAAEETH